MPTLICRDGAPAIIAVIKEVFPRSLRQRCLFHKTQNILEKVPENEAQTVKASLVHKACLR